MRQLSLALVAACLTAAAAAESAWPPTSISSFELTDPQEITAVAVGSDGVFVLNGARLQKYAPGGQLLDQTLVGAEGVFRYPLGIDIDAAGTVYVADTYASRVQLFDANLGGLGTWQGEGYLEYPRTLRFGSNGDVFVKGQTNIEVLGPDGALVRSWDAVGYSGLTVDADGNVLLAGAGTFQRHRPNGSVIETLGGRQHFGDVAGFVETPQGIFLHERGGPILAFDQDGIYRGSFGSSEGIFAMCLDGQGRIVAIQGERVVRFGPIGTLPPAPPPPPGASSAVILHIAPAGEFSTACKNGPVSVVDVVTRETARRDGSAVYFVYLLGMPRSGSEGLLGIQCGIDHDDRGQPQDPLRIQLWTACSDLEFPTDDWPGPSSGNTLTWVECDFRPLVVGGYFFVTAYDASIMTVAPYPQPPEMVKTANCDGAENVVEQYLGLERVGWVSMGGGAVGLDTDGCNPAFEPCASLTVPVTPTTWGRLKVLYGGGR